jgi:hypothetical protein
LCSRCCDGYHGKKCLGLNCTCPCRDPKLPRKPKMARDPDGLSNEEREAQGNFDFDSCGSFKV